MSTIDLLDPAVRPAIEALPEFSLDANLLPSLRQVSSEMFELVDLKDAGVSREEVLIPGFKEEDPAVRCLKYSPLSSLGKTGAYLHIHGGGYVLGAPEMADARNVELAAALGITILSVDYRLSPEYPIPAPLNDCYAALVWLSSNADELGIDPQRIAIGGESAGGGLAAATALYAVNVGDIPICFQLLTYPMLDHRTGSAENPGDPLTGEFVWTREKNQTGWQYYLGGAAATAPFVPACAEDLSGLPPAWIGTATLDLFRDENIAYAQRLMSAGVATQLVVYPGACHGFQQAIDAPVTKQYMRDHAEALRLGLDICD